MKVFVSYLQSEIERINEEEASAQQVDRLNEKYFLALPCIKFKKMFYNIHVNIFFFMVLGC